MRAAVLFAGIGGWEIACEMHGIEVAWACEWDEWKRARYLERWPDAVLMGDVEKIDGRQMLRDHGPIDLLLGSPPCTDISAANVNGCGIDGAESRYYLEAIRLARETGARWIGFENSPRLRTRGADRVLDLLGDAGYARWPCVVEAEDAGAPHERGRSFVLGCRRDALGAAGSDAKGATRQRQGRQWQDAGPEPDRTADLDDASDTIGGGLRQQPGRRGRTHGTGAAEPESHADADLDRQPYRAEHGQVGRSAGIDGAAGECGGEAADVSRIGRRSRGARRPDPGHQGKQAEQFARPTPCHSDRARLAEWQGVGSDHATKLTPAQRAALSPWDHRGDGLAGYLSVADGLATRLRGHGLSERAVKAELARWRSALGDALVIPVVWAVVRAIVRTDRGL